MNKKGIGKTLEATIAIILILAFMFYFTPPQEVGEPLTPHNVEEAQVFILQQISTKTALRDCALQATRSGECNTVCTNIASLVQTETPPGFAAACEICPTASTCSGNRPIDVSLYTDSVFLSGPNPKVVRIYFWRKQ